MEKNFHSIAIFFLEELDFKEKKSPHTLKSYSLDLQQALAFLQKGRFIGPPLDGSPKYQFVSEKASPPPLCNEAQLQSGISKFLHSLSPLESSTRGRKVATLKKFYSFLKREKIIENIPYFLVTPKKAFKLPHFISVDEAIAILKSFSSLKKEEQTQHRVLFLLLYGVGLRVSEACHLQWKDINLAQRHLRVQGKGNKQRQVIFPKGLLQSLQELQVSQPGTYLWGEKALLTRTAYNWIRLCGVRAGLQKHLHPHALRHSYATHLLSDGADLRVIQELLGHSHLSATEKYTHVSLDQLAQTMESFHPLAKKA